MNYPFWDVPLIGAGWVIGIISIFHVMISHFAVGGGLLIPMLERRALNLKSPEWMAALRRNMRFFLIVTGVLGTVSGVGIWFSIGLAQPTGTSALIHIFVFFWAVEWIFFLIELTSAAIYYYSWGRISERLHVAMGWVYCVSSFFTLFIINGILSFMLTPGQEWLQANGMREFSGAVLYAFFNPTFWPSLLIRALACLSLAAVFVLMSASRIRGEMQPALKAGILRYLLRWFVPGLLLLPLGIFWLLHMLPQSQLNLLKLPELNLMPIALSVIFVSVLTAVAAFILVWPRPLKFTPARAWILMILAAVVVSGAEYSREMLRKPFVIVGYMYSNGVRVSDVERYNTEGYLTKSLWVDEENDFAAGKAMFRGQCMICHTWSGYRSMDKLLKGRNKESLQSVLDMLHEYSPEYRFTQYMPPLVGTLAERRALAVWLENKAQLKGSEGEEKK
ncbi:MAG: cytochrome ubiquinol oxidase subunit I [Verrucomicrobia bacterium]|nr:cytochrome ubiquinol oxidase subunit I [Verrucomicrobiota bacterium]